MTLEMAKVESNQAVSFPHLSRLAFNFQDTVEAEIVKVETYNFYLYGKVEFKIRDAATGYVTQRCEAIVARGFDRDSLKVVKKMPVGSKVRAYFFFGKKRAEWMAEGVRPVRCDGVSRGLTSNGCSRDLMATFSKIPAQVILKPKLAVKLIACGAVVKLMPGWNYFDGNEKKIDFRVAEQNLEQDAVVKVDASLCGNKWFITKVFLPVGSKQPLPLTVEPLPDIHELGPLATEGDRSSVQEALEPMKRSFAEEESSGFLDTEPPLEPVETLSEGMGKLAFPQDELLIGSHLSPNSVQTCQETKSAEANDAAPRSSNLEEGLSKTNGEVECNLGTTDEAEEKADFTTEELLSMTTAHLITG